MLLLRLLRFRRIPGLALRLMLDRRTPLGAKLLMVAAIVYLFSPIDFLPDLFFPLIGLIDDLILGLVALGVLLASAPRPVVEERPDGANRGRRNGGEGRSDGDNVIEGEYRHVPSATERPPTSA